MTNYLKPSTAGYPLTEEETNIIYTKVYPKYDKLIHYIARRFYSLDATEDHDDRVQEINLALYLGIEGFCRYKLPDANTFDEVVQGVFERGDKYIKTTMWHRQKTIAKKAAIERELRGDLDVWRINDFNQDDHGEALYFAENHCVHKY
jgi:hypothetical protein